MTLSKPSWILEEYVVAAATHYRAHPSVITAHAAIEQLFHFADRIYEYCEENRLAVLGGRSFRSFRDHLIASEPDMSLADRVTNVGKHHRIERGGIEYTSTGQFFDDKGVFWILNGNGQKFRTVDDLLTSGVAMSQRWLQAHPGL